MSPGTAAARRAARRPISRDVRLFWCASAFDALGTQASGVVLPLLLLGLGHSAAVVGLVAGASTAAGLLLAPLAAIPADRGARKPVMFWSATTSAVAMAGVAAAAVGKGRAARRSRSCSVPSWWNVSPRPCTKPPPPAPWR